MKRSEVNRAFQQARACFARHGWALPPAPAWDITDFGLGDFARFGLTLINLANEPEYCEKLMYARAGQTTPIHTHARKQEDIICRWGALELRLWAERPDATAPAAAPGSAATLTVGVNGAPTPIAAGRPWVLPAGSRVTLKPGVWHSFAPASEECIIGEVSTANDDRGDNFFADPRVGRFPGLEEDEPSLIRLVSE